MKKTKLLVGLCAILAFGGSVQAQSDDEAIHNMLERSRAELEEFERRLLQTRPADPGPTLEERRAEFAKPLEGPAVLTYNPAVGGGNLVASLLLSMTMDGWQVVKHGHRWRAWRYNHLYCDQLPCEGRLEALEVAARQNTATQEFELAFDIFQAGANDELVPLREQGVVQNLRKAITPALMVAASWPFGDRGPAGEGRVAWYDELWRSTLQANGYGTQPLASPSQLEPGKSEALVGTLYHAKTYTEPFEFNGIPVKATVRPWARYHGHPVGEKVHQHIDFFDELMIENGEHLPIFVYRRGDSVQVREAVNRTASASR